MKFSGIAFGVCKTSNAMKGENARTKRVAATLAISVVLSGFLVFTSPSALAENIAKVNGLDYSSATQSFSLLSTGAVSATVNAVNIGTNKRIILDIEDAEIGTLPNNTILLKTLAQKWPAIKNISVNQFGGTHPVVRILLDVDGINYNTAITQNNASKVELKIAPVSISSASPIPFGTPPGARPLISTRTANPNLNTDEINELKRSLSLMNQRYNQVAQENQSLKTSLQKQSGQKPAAPAPNTTGLRNEITVLQTKLGTLQSQNNQLSEQLKTARAQAAAPKQTTAKPALSEAQIAEIRAQLDQAKNALNKSISTINEQNKEIAFLKRQVEQMQGVADTNAREQLTLLNSKIETKDKEITSLKEQVGVLNEKIQAANSQDDPLITDLRKQLQEKDLLLTQTNAKLANSEQRAQTGANREAEVASLRAQLASTQEALTKETQAKLALSNKNGDKKALGTQEGQVKELKAAIAKSEDERKAREAELATQKQQVAELSKEREELRYNEQALMEKLMALQKQQADNSDKKAKASSVTATNETLKEVETLKKEKAQLKSVNESLFAEVATLKAAAAKAPTSSKRNDNPPKDSTSKDRISALQGQLKQLEEDKTTLSMQVETLQTQNQSLNEKLGAQKTESAKAGSDPLLKAQTDETAAMNLAMMKQQLSESQEKLQDMDSRYKRILGEYDKLKHQQDKSGKGLGKQSSEELLVENKHLKTQLDDLSGKLKLAEGKALELQKKMVSTTPAVEAAENAVQPSSALEAEKQFKQAQVLEAQNKIAEATEAYRNAQNLQPKDPNYVTALTRSLAAQKHYAEAVGILKDYIRDNPQQVEMNNTLGKIYLMNGQVVEANGAFKQAISTSSLSNYATTLKKQGKLQEAEQVFKAVLEINPSDSEVLFNLGNIYNAENNLKDAMDIYNQALNINPDFAEAHYNLGLVYSKLGDKPKAVQHLEKFLQLVPTANNAEVIRSYVKKLKS